MNPPPLHHAFTDWAVATVFGVVYLGMFLGGLPRLRLDRTGVALLGAIAMMAITGMTVNQAASAIDVSTLLLLFAFEAVIIGGMGSFWGTLAGALLLGLTQQIGFRLDPGWGIWGGHLMFLLVLVLRPPGLFPKTRG